MKTHSSSGFTLIELLVVIAIISLLSSVLLASVNVARAKAIASNKVQTVKQYMTAFELYRSDHNTYPVFSGITEGVGYCLGAGNPGGTCYGEAYNEESALNGVLQGYIPGPPADTSSIIVDTADIRGIIYKCTELIGAECTHYEVRWFIEGADTLCGGGDHYSGNGFVECTISK